MKIQYKIFSVEINNKFYYNIHKSIDGERFICVKSIDSIFNNFKKISKLKSIAQVEFFENRDFAEFKLQRLKGLDRLPSIFELKKYTN